MSTPASILGRTPLLLPALGFTLGILVARFGTQSLDIFVPVTFAFAVASSVGLRGSAGRWLAMGLLFVSMGYARQHLHQNDFADDEIGRQLGDFPILVRVRATVVDEPDHRRASTRDPLVSVDRPESTTMVVVADEIFQDERWQTISGRIRVSVALALPDLHCGDRVELLGTLSHPLPPGNPAEKSYAEHLRDDRILCVLSVRGGGDLVQRLQAGGTFSLSAMLARLRGRCQRTIREAVPASSVGLSEALLLGDSPEMSRAEWEPFVRTGVIHVLAISGQHLVVLGGFVLVALRVFGTSRRTSVVIVAVVVLVYALLTGGRPSAVRAAIAFFVVAGAVLLRRRALAGNSLALAWLLVLMIQPADLFGLGFQLSFLNVFLLVRGLPQWLPDREKTPLEVLIDQSRPAPVRWLRSLLGGLWKLGLIGAILWGMTLPIVAWRQNMVAPVALLIGPPSIVLTSVALLTGFATMLVGGILPSVAGVSGWVTGTLLKACRELTEAVDSTSWGTWYLPDFDIAWAVAFYLILALWLLGPSLPGVAGWVTDRRAIAALILVSVGAVYFGGVSRSKDELRMAFLSVGHGTCVVAETPEGAVYLYDVGSMAGPELVRRSVAPYLWSRGVSHIDELFLSHADLDHFNGLPELLRRFPVDRINLTPSFRSKPAPGVRLVTAEIDRRQIPVRVLHAGVTLDLGETSFEVLHPPTEGPVGAENLRSMVLEVRHRNRTILLTGDLEKAGQEMLLSLPPRRIDLLMAPHHGSPLANTDALPAWCSPKLVVATAGFARSPREGEVYRRRGITWLSTMSEGAVTVRSSASGMAVETFVTKRTLIPGRD